MTIGKVYHVYIGDYIQHTQSFKKIHELGFYKGDIKDIVKSITKDYNIREDAYLVIEPSQCISIEPNTTQLCTKNLKVAVESSIDLELRNAFDFDTSILYKDNYKIYNITQPDYEEMRECALEKLTKAERRLLGLD